MAMKGGREREREREKEGLEGKLIPPPTPPVLRNLRGESKLLLYSTVRYLSTHLTTPTPNA